MERLAVVCDWRACWARCRAVYGTLAPGRRAHVPRWLRRWGVSGCTWGSCRCSQVVELRLSLLGRRQLVKGCCWCQHASMVLRRGRRSVLLLPLQQSRRRYWFERRWGWQGGQQHRQHVLQQLERWPLQQVLLLLLPLALLVRKQLLQLLHLRRQLLHARRQQLHIVRVQRLDGCLLFVRVPLLPLLLLLLLLPLPPGLLLALVLLPVLPSHRWHHWQGRLAPPPQPGQRLRRLGLELLKRRCKRRQAGRLARAGRGMLHTLRQLALHAAQQLPLYRLQLGGGRTWWITCKPPRARPWRKSADTKRLPRRRVPGLSPRVQPDQPDQPASTQRSLPHQLQALRLLRQAARLCAAVLRLP